MGEILLIEDSPETAFIIKKALAPDDQVTECGTLAEARRRLRENRYELILLDVSLPDGDGFEFLSSLNGPEGIPSPVLFITAKSAVSDQVLGYSLGAEDYIIKPVHPILL